MAPSCSTCFKKVLMTGFTPLKGFEINPSWQGVKFMDKTRIENKYDIALIRKEVPVIYEVVDELIPRLLKEYQPYLTIHVGVSEDSCFVLETQASIEEYKTEDNVGNNPSDGKNKCAGPKTLVTQLDVAAICRQFNSNPSDKLQSKMSSDAGQFLCEYIYYTSLCLGRTPTLFVHVPNGQYSNCELAQGLERILELCLKQLLQEDDYYSCCC